MRFLCLAGLVLGLFIQSSHAQSGTIYFAGGVNSAFERTVTVSKNGAMIASFTLPKGTFLSAAEPMHGPVKLPGGSFEFHGSVELRIVPAADGPKGSMSAQDIMSRAALVVSGEGVDVTLEQRH